MRLSYLLIPIAALGFLGASSLQASLATWGPIQPSYRLVMQYRTDAYVLDHALSREDCRQSLPFGDNVKQVHFACEQED